MKILRFEDGGDDAGDSEESDWDSEEPDGEGEPEEETDFEEE